MILELSISDVPEDVIDKCRNKEVIEE